MKQRNKFSIEQKEKIVLEAQNQKDSINGIAKKYGTCDRSISLWIECYKKYGVNGLSFRKKMSYTTKFKKELIKKMIRDELSLHQASVQYLIAPSTLSKWRRMYKKNGEQAFIESKPRGRPPKMKKEPINKQSCTISEKDKLLIENERLRAENDYLKKLHALIQKQKAQKKG